MPPFSVLRRSICTVPDTRALLRALLRDTAQPVAVVTARLPASDTPTYHGATLSSFTSIALDPHPLVAFSLRVPSRMASALNAHTKPTSTSTRTTHLVINLLSAAQPHLAKRFARPDLYPCPFADAQVPFVTSPDGLPVLSGTLGALSCRLVGPSLPLAHVCDTQTEGEVQRVSGESGLASELFIARVLCVERVPLSEHEQTSALDTLPLVYHRRRYTTVREQTLDA